MLTKVLALVLVVLIGLALGIETARYVHAHATGVDASGVVNIHHALGFSLLATSGALLLSLSREWLSRQWTRFTVWFELTLDGLFDFDNRSREICRRRSENGACAQDALDDAAKTTCTGCGVRGHWWPDCPSARPPNAALPCRGCSWCGKDPGDLPDELWTECDGSGYLPSVGAERKLTRTL